MIAWAFSREGHQVDLYEKDTLVSATSRASSKMLHGGIRYLEQGHFGLVRESLHERAWWLKQAPHLTKQLELLLPVYKSKGRSRWVIGLGTALYAFLARGSGFPSGRWYLEQEVSAEFPNLKRDGLIGAYSYWDGQMDDYQLGVWAADQARASGAELHEREEVSDIDPIHGIINVSGESKRFDLIINATGPWATELLNKSGIQSDYALDLIKGTHILVPGDIRKGCVLQVVHEKRIVFVLPYQGNTLIGTTESKVESAKNFQVSELEVEYLIQTYNQYFTNKLSRNDVLEAFCGIRPIAASGINYSKASRESILERNGKLINVYGGKWTTSRSLAKSVLSLVSH